MSTGALHRAGYTEAWGITEGSTALTTLTPSGTLNTKGAWAQLIASTGGEVQAVTLVLDGAGNQNRSYLIDLGIGGAGSEVVVVPDMYVFRRALSMISRFFTIPLRVPAGVRVAARCQASGGGATMLIGAWGHVGGVHAPQGFVRSESIGTISGTSSATAVAPSATAHTKGSWTQLAASTAEPILGGFVVHVHPNDRVDVTDYALLDIGVGGSGSEVAIAENIMVITEGAAERVSPDGFFVPCQIPAGTRISARIQSDAATGDTFTVALNGFS